MKDLWTQNRDLSIEDPAHFFIGHILASGGSWSLQSLLACLVTNRSHRALWEGSVVASETKTSG